MKKEWNKIENTQVLKYLHFDYPEVIYIIKTGFDDTYIVVHEDAHEITIGNTFVGAKKDVEKRYNIEI